MRWLLATALALAACRGGAERVTVAVATAARSVAPDLETAFEADHAGDVTLLFGGSGTLADDVVTGSSDIDVVLLADRARIDLLADKGFVDTDSRAPVAATRLVLVASRPAPHVSFATLGQLPGDDSIAIGNPEHSAAGVHARTLLRRLGLWDPLRARMVLGGDVAAALAAVRRGQAQVAIVYEPDVRGAKDMEVLDRAEPPPIPELWVAVTRRGADRELAVSFASFLRSETAQRLFREHGFVAPASPRRE